MAAARQCQQQQQSVEMWDRLWLRVQCTAWCTPLHGGPDSQWARAVLQQHCCAPPRLSLQRALARSRGALRPLTCALTPSLLLDASLALPPAVSGVKAFEPGLLAKANRGILYVDEVNLLDDHLVDVLLDSAASGWNTVEREGISISHPARFILVGSGEAGLAAWERARAAGRAARCGATGLGRLKELGYVGDRMGTVYLMVRDSVLLPLPRGVMF